MRKKLRNYCLIAFPILLQDFLYDFVGTGIFVKSNTQNLTQVLNYHQLPVFGFQFLLQISVDSFQFMYLLMVL